MRKNVKKYRKIDFLFLSNFVPKKIKILFVFLATKGESPEEFCICNCDLRRGGEERVRVKKSGYMDPGSEPDSLTRLSSISTFVARKLPQTTFGGESSQ